MADAAPENTTVPTGASRCTLIVPTDRVESCGVMVVQVPARAIFAAASKQSSNIALRHFMLAFLTAGGAHISDPTVR